MYDYIVTTTRNSLSDLWPTDVYESYAVYTMDVVSNLLVMYPNCVADVSITEDGLSQTVRISFETEEDLQGWKQYIEARPEFTDIITLCKSWNDDSDSSYTISDSLIDYDSYFA